MARKAAGKTADTVDSQSSVEEISGQVCQRVKALRKERGWSLEELSAKCGVSRSMLSEIERDRANPTLAVTLRIARAFDLSLGELVDEQPSTETIEVIRSEDPRFHYKSEGDCRIRTLSPLQLEKDVEFYEVRLNPGGELRSSPHFQGTREFLTVEKGKVRLESGEASVDLERGDSASYRADVPHAIVNAGRSEALVFLVATYP